MRNLIAYVASLAFAAVLGAQIDLTSGSASYSQDFNTLPASGTTNTWTDNSTLAGWYARQSIGTLTTIRAGDGTSNTGALYSFGTGTASDRALGSIGSGTPGDFTWGIRIRNNDATLAIASIQVAYTGEQWRNGGNTTPHTAAFSYQVGATDLASGTWTDFNALDFVGPIATATASALDGNAAANRVVITAQTITVSVPVGQEIWLRWFDPNNTGNDHGLAIDDFSVTATFAAGAAPGVVSSVRASANPTNAASVQFTVTFSQSVTGVDATDFALTVSGITGAGVTGVSGSGTTYTVTVNTGSGNGTLRLDVIDDDTIVNAGSTPLGGAGSGNGNFNTGESYNVDKTAPAVVSSVRASASPTSASSVQFTVTFSESVSGVDVSDFGLNTTGITGAAVSAVSGSGTTYTVTVNTGSGSGTLRLDIIDDDTIADAAANPLGGAGAGNGNFNTGETYTIDKTPPAVVASVRASANPTSAQSVDFTVTFSESVTGVDAADFSVLNAGTTVTAPSITGVSGSGTTYTVTVDTGSGSGTLRLDLIDDDSIADAVGNALGGSGAGNGNFTTGEHYTVNKIVPNTPPTVVLTGGALNYTENDPATLLDGGATVTDADSADFDTGNLTATISLGGSADDRLEVRNQGSGPGQIGVTGANVSYSGTLIGTFSGGVGTSALVLVFNSNATPAAAQALLRNLTYRNVSDAPTIATRTVSVTVNDGDGGTSSAATRQINVSAINDAPALTLPGAAINYTANDAATILDAGATVTDPDSASFTTGLLTVDYAANGSSDDRLEIRNQGTAPGQIGVSGSDVSFGGTIIGTFAGGSGLTALVVTFNASSTPAAAEALCRNITFRNVSSAPSTLTRSVRFVITDGAGGTSPAATKSVNVGISGTAPLITSTPGTSATVGLTYTYAVIASGTPAPTITTGALPVWLTLSGNTLSGTPSPTDAGTSPTITITASNGVGTPAQQVFTITVAGAGKGGGGDSDGSGGCTVSELASPLWLLLAPILVRLRRRRR